MRRSGRCRDETHLRAFASLHRFAGRSSVRTWLLAIARRVCADALRTWRRRPVVVLVEPAEVTDGADRVGEHAAVTDLPRRLDAGLLRPSC